MALNACLSCETCSFICLWGCVAVGGRCVLKSDDNEPNQTNLHYFASVSTIHFPSQETKNGSQPQQAGLSFISKQPDSPCLEFKAQVGSTLHFNSSLANTCESTISPPSFDWYSCILTGFVKPTCLSYGWLTLLLYEELFQYPGSVHSNGKHVFIFDELMRALDRSWWGPDQQSKRSPKQNTNWMPPPHPFLFHHLLHLPLSLPSLSPWCLCMKVFCVWLYDVELCMFAASDVDINNSFSLTNTKWSRWAGNPFIKHFNDAFLQSAMCLIYAARCYLRGEKWV